MMKKYKNLMKLFLLLFMAGAMSSYAQITVKGTVTDTEGDPLPGAEIIVVGSKTGVVTDFDGHYKIQAKQGDKLRVSFIGLATQTKKVTGSKMDFVLKNDALGLDQVVVTAQSGVVTKKQLGSVVHSVKMDQINERNVANVAEALQGALPGAQIMRNNGSAAPSISIRLRGPSSLLGNSDPLIMIDGMIINNKARSAAGSGGSSDPLSDIDMSNIDHIEIIKGPAASAMYGSMASNGIIQIFTKKGKTGEPSVTVTSSFNINQLRKAKPYNKALYKWTKVNGVYVKTPIEERYDYQSYIFRKAYGSYNGVNVSGSNDWTSYSIGGSVLQNEGIIRNSDYNRKNLDLKFNQKITDWLKFNVNVIYSKNKTKEIPFASGSNYRYAPLQSILFADNSVNPVNEDGTYASMGWQGNPYEAIDKIDAVLNIDRVISNFAINTKPMKNLNLDYIFGYDFTSSNSKFKVPFGFGSTPSGLLLYSAGNYNTLSSHIKANYKYDITDNIKATTGIGYQYLYDKRTENSQKKPTLSIFDNIENMDGANDIQAYSHQYEYAIWGTWVQQHFTLYDKLHLTFGGRWDKASTFGDDVQSFYPKVSGSLVLSDFDFWEKSLSKYVNSFKLRGAWGEAGNMSALTGSSLIAIREGSLYVSDSYLGQTTYHPKSQDGNAGVRPEVTKELEFGFDAGLLDGKIGIEFSTYHQDVYDLLLSREMSPSTGFASRVSNVGTLLNDGIEVTLKGMPMKTKDFTWNASINYSRNKNEVSGIDGGWIKFGGYGTSIAANGYPLGVFYGYFYATDSNGNQVLDRNGNPQLAKGVQLDKDGDGFPESFEQQFDVNGQPTGDKLKKIIGDPNPDYILSVSNTFKYKNFSLNLAVEAVQGFDIMSWDKRMGYSFRISDSDGSPSLFTGWDFAGQELENDNRGYYGNRFRIYESFVEDASFIKLRNVSLSYHWKKPVKGIKSANFTISGSNLISWDSYWGYDPEVNSWGKSNVTRAQDYGNIPVPKVYTFGVKLKF
jgi:TonB-linked SusC/RagA family outer membrane protein